MCPCARELEDGIRRTEELEDDVRGMEDLGETMFVYPQLSYFACRI